MDIVMVTGEDTTVALPVLGVVVMWYPLAGGTRGAVQDISTILSPTCIAIGLFGASPTAHTMDV